MALIVADEPRGEDELRESPAPDYLLAAGAWTALRVTRAELEADPRGWADRLAAAAEALGALSSIEAAPD